LKRRKKKKKKKGQPFEKSLSNGLPSFPFLSAKPTMPATKANNLNRQRYYPACPRQKP